MKKNKKNAYIILHLAILILSIGSVCSKAAATQEWISLELVFFYGLSMFCLLIYAFLWQQVLKHLPLTVAFANKAVFIMYGVFWGWLLFDESITVNMVVGMIVVFAGVMLIITDGKDKKEIKEDLDEQ